MIDTRAYTFMRGHKIFYDWDLAEWFYEDGKKYDDSRSCPRCGKFPTPEGYDACIGYIKGARSVCCGHGVTKPIRLMKK